MTNHFTNLLLKKLSKPKGKILLNKSMDLYNELIEVPINTIIKELSYMPIGKPFYYYSEMLKQVRDDYVKNNTKHLYYKLASPQMRKLLDNIGKKV